MRPLIRRKIPTLLQNNGLARVCLVLSAPASVVLPQVPAPGLAALMPSLASLLWLLIAAYLLSVQVQKQYISDSCKPNNLHDHILSSRRQRHIYLIADKLYKYMKWYQMHMLNPAKYMPTQQVKVLQVIVSVVDKVTDQHLCHAWHWQTEVTAPVTSINTQQWVYTSYKTFTFRPHPFFPRLGVKEAVAPTKGGQLGRELRHHLTHWP